MIKRLEKDMENTQEELMKNISGSKLEILDLLLEIVDDVKEKDMEKGDTGAGLKLEMGKSQLLAVAHDSPYFERFVAILGRLIQLKHRFKLNGNIVNQIKEDYDYDFSEFLP